MPPRSETTSVKSPAPGAGTAREAVEAGPPASPESLVIVTGLSGSGKSYVNNTLQDMGYFCVDNLPLELVEPLLARIRYPRVGIILDVRNPDFAKRFPEILGRLRRKLDTSEYWLHRFNCFGLSLRDLELTHAATPIQL
jgi:hypothetical protein